MANTLHFGTLLAPRF